MNSPNSLKIASLSRLEYQNRIAAHLGKGKRHAALLYQDFFRLGPSFSTASKVEPQAQSLLAMIQSLTDFSLPEVSESRQEGDVIKFLLRFSDGKESESVCIPMLSGTTLCISSQIGCKMGCAFCQTAKMGLVRHLEVHEIVEQVLVAKFVFKQNVRNIVFMGMGEPLDNYQAVMQAIKVLTDPHGLGFGPSRITISTSGRVDGIDQLIRDADPALNLAVSVNGPTDAIRQKTMPINRLWNLEELKRAMIRYCEHPRRKIFIEYVLLQGVNDSVDCAHLLAEYLKDLRVTVNVIPYNAQVKSRFLPPTVEQMDLFVQTVRQHGCRVFVRTTKGDQIRAACGQLGRRLSVS